MYNSPLRPAIDADAHEILMVLLSPYHKLEENDPRPMVQRPAAYAARFDRWYGLRARSGADRHVRK